MRPLRVVYSVVLVVSLAAAAVFYYREQLKDTELSGYRQLGQVSGAALRNVSAKLARSKKELEKSLEEIEMLSAAITVLKKDNLKFKGELQALKREGQTLRVNVDRLMKDKTVLDNLDKRSFSLEELKRLIKIVKIERRIERIQRRLTKMAMLKKLDEIALQQGNKGYLISQGTSTFKSSTRVRVKLEPVGR